MLTKILWIDDEIELLRPFIYILEKKGFKVDSVSNGTDGLNLFRKENYDIVLLDEIMPGMDGVSVLKEIKQMDPDVNIIMITKSEEEPLMNEAFSYFLDSFIIKPFSPSQLIATLKKFVEQKELMRKKLEEDYGNLIRSEITPNNIEDWSNHYKNMMTWKIKIHKYGNESLKMLHQGRRDTLSKSFVKFFVDNYKKLIKEKPELFSPSLLKKYVFPYLKQGEKVFFLLIDAMRYDQWLLMAKILKELYRVKTDTHLSILPTATPFARNAIFSGMFPLDIYKFYPEYWVWEQKGQNRYEEQLLEKNLIKEGLTMKFKYYKANTESHIKENVNNIVSSGAPFIAFVLNFLDIFAHSIYSTNILKDIVQNEWALLDITRAWFLNSSLNNLIEKMIKKDYRIVITSDHGFIMVDKPTIIKGGMGMTLNLRYKFGLGMSVNPKDAIILSPEEIKIPSGRKETQLVIAKNSVYFIYPSKPREYKKQYQYSFQHGGISLEEIFTPVGIIQKK